MANGEDVTVLRELARQVAEIAAKRCHVDITIRDHETLPAGRESVQPVGFGNVRGADQPTDTIEATGIVPRGMRRTLRNRP